MELKLTVDAAMFDESFGKMLSNMSQDEIKEIFKQVIQNWITEPFDLERKVHGNKVIANLRKLTGYNNRLEFPESVSDAEIRRSYRFEDEMKKFKGVKEQFIDELLKQFSSSLKLAVNELISTDEILKDHKDKILAVVIEQFPEYVKQAVLLWFANHIGTIQHQLLDLICNSQTLDFRIQEKIKQGFGL